MAPSRLVDDFHLEFRLMPPQQPEEDAVRDFVAWMSQIVISDTGPFTSIADFVNDLRNELGSLGSPPNPMGFGSPLTGVRIHTSDLPLFMDAAFRIWVTEIRPLFHVAMPSAGCSCVGNASPLQDMTDDALLLAEVDVPVAMVGQGWQVDNAGKVTIDETRRPILVHTRMLQEWLLAGPQTK